jgi:hypothetical protein
MAWGTRQSPEQATKILPSSGRGGGNGQLLHYAVEENHPTYQRALGGKGADVNSHFRVGWRLLVGRGP